VSEIRAEKARKRVQEQRQKILRIIQPDFDRFKSGYISRNELCDRLMWVTDNDVNLGALSSFGKNFKNGAICNYCPKLSFLGCR